jgi:hypothetical protein
VPCSIAGSVLGATIYTASLEILRPLGVWRMALMALLLVLLMLFRPRGIMGLRELAWVVPKRDLKPGKRTNLSRPNGDEIKPAAKPQDGGSVTAQAVQQALELAQAVADMLERGENPQAAREELNRLRNHGVYGKSVRQALQKTFGGPEMASAQIRQLATAAQDNPKLRDLVQFHCIGEEEARTLKESTGIAQDISGYEHAVDTSFINKILRGIHANETREAARGQVPVTLEDFALIPEIIEHYDKIERAALKPGLERIRYEKWFNSQMIFLEEVRTGRKQLAAVTMWKMKRPPGAVGATDVSQASSFTSEAYPVMALQSIIGKNAGDVKGRGNASQLDGETPITGSTPREEAADDAAAR